MAKAKTVFRCGECGAETVRWAGRCPECGEWDCLREESKPRAEESGAFRFSTEGVSGEGSGAESQAHSLASVDLAQEPRLSTGLGEFDRVLGGGLVAGAAILLGGDPGIGKSTLLLQVCQRLSRRGETTLYVSGEETGAQIRLRSDRVGEDAAEILVLPSGDLESILREAERHRPKVVVLDSIQTVQIKEVAGVAGSTGQVRECAQALVSLAKKLGIPIFLIGHVTKEGVLAGPRVLEHLVDTVLYFEGDRHHAHRILRAVKNRFGPTDEVGILQMEERGLVEVSDPSLLFVGDRLPEPGTVVFPALEGTRSILVEVQALTARAPHGTPARRVSGVHPQRVAMILAVLEQKTGLQLHDQDVFVNAVGGVRVDEPACDLAIALAVASCRLEAPMPPRTVALGEIGLSGEVRRVGRLGARLKEARRLGYSGAILPQGNLEEGGDGEIGVERVVESLAFLRLAEEAGG